MNLHQVGKRPDWQMVAPEQRNWWQRIAARSFGIVTPANLLSVIGIVLVCFGVWQLYIGNAIVGLVLIGIGRLNDILDGIVAEATRTKSPLGEALDAALDKVAIVLLLAVFIWQAAIPVWALLAIGALNALNAVCAIIAKFRKQEIHPSQLGKLSAAAIWAILLAYGAASAIGNPGSQAIVLWVTHGALLISLGFGVAALVDYAKTALQPLGSLHAEHEQPASTFERFLVLRNPTSTNAKFAAKLVQEIHKRFPNIPSEVLITPPGGREATRQLLEDHADQLGPSTLLCIAGGDGTVNTTIETLLLAGNLPAEARQTPILPLWGGNANDLATMLNGVGSLGRAKDIFSKGKLVSIYPLECIMRIKRKGRLVRLAAAYISFGASANAARRLNDPAHRKSWLNAIPGGRLLQELATVAGAFLEATPFTVSEGGTTQPVYERLFANGSRMAKLDAMPVQLTAGEFYRISAETKHPAHLAQRLFDFITRRRAPEKLTKPARFTTQAPAWAQFDGEVMHIPERTKVTIKLAREPFYALSVKQTSK